MYSFTISVLRFAGRMITISMKVFRRISAENRMASVDSVEKYQIKVMETEYEHEFPEK